MVMHALFHAITLWGVRLIALHFAKKADTLPDDSEVRRKRCSIIILLN
jgi:hypothetical protein